MRNPPRPDSPSARPLQAIQRAQLQEHCPATIRSAAPGAVPAGPAWPRPLAVLLAALACSLPALSYAQSSRPRRLIMSMSPLAKARSVSFHAEVSKITHSGPNSEKLSLAPAERLTVVAERPSSIRIEATFPERWGPAILFNPFRVFVSNGLEQVDLAPDSGVSFKSRAAPRLADVRSDVGLPNLLPMDVQFSQEPLSPPFAPSTGGSAVPGRAGVQRMLSTATGQIKQVLRTDGVTGFPIRYSEFAKLSGCWMEVERIEFTDWRINLEVPAGTFDLPPAR